MKKLLICLILIFTNSIIFSQVLNKEGFYTYESLIEEINRLSNLYPNICKKYDIGDSRGKEYYQQGYDNYAEFNHDIIAIKVSDNVSVEEDEPAIYFIGLHHGDEVLSLEVVMDILKSLLENYSSNSSVHDYINNSQIWFIPLINPDGHKVSQEYALFRDNIWDKNNNKQFDVLQHYIELNEASFQCLSTKNISSEILDELTQFKNKKFSSQNLFFAAIQAIPNFPNSQPENSELLQLIFGCANEQYIYDLDGKDLNRNYASPEGISSYEDWTEPETRAIRDFFNSHHFVTGISYHGYKGIVLMPYSYNRGLNNEPDYTILNDIGNELARSINYNLDETFYNAQGTSSDYGYGFHGILNFTVELEPNILEYIPTKAERDRICSSNIQGAYYLIERLSHSMLTGIIKDNENNQPIEAKILIEEGIDDLSDQNQKPIHTSNRKFGRYYRLLNQGNYTVTIMADGYIPQTFTNVNISETGITELNVKLTKGTGYYWPLDKDYNPSTGVDLSSQHTIIGQFGDCTGNRENINKGIEIKVPTNKQVGVYAVQSGIAYTDFSSVSIGNFRYENLKSIQISSGKNIAQGTLIGYVNGDRLLFMENTNTLTSFKPADNWINPLRKNGLTPYEDNASPVINGFVMYQNGTETDMGGRIFGKVDIVIDAFDPAVNSDGSANNDYNCGIYKLVIQFLNSKGEEISNSKIEYFSGFSKMPNCSPKEMYASGANSETFLYIGTNDPFNSPYDKYWNSRQKRGKPYNVDAMFPSEAKFAEGGLKIKVTVYDYAGNKAETD